jgi:Ser/Thr protein kinase RdoA (MazF antagonist)
MLTRQKIPAATLKTILKDFDIGKIRKITPQATSGNIAYDIETNKNRFILRLAPSGQRWRSRREIHSELEVLAFLRKHKFPVANPVWVADDKKIVAWGNPYGYLREFVNGQPKLNPSPEEIRQFGKLFGRFHVLMKNYKTQYRRMHNWGPAQTRKHFQVDIPLLRKSPFKKMDEFITRYERELRALHFPAGLPSGTIHEDLGRRHVLWRNKKIVGVLDFDRCYFGPLILDFGQAGRGWCFTNDWATWKNENFRALLSGYQSARKLTKLEKKYAVAAIKFGILERALSFCLRYIYVTHDQADMDFADYSISDQGPLGMVEKNRPQIEKWLK